MRYFLLKTAPSTFFEVRSLLQSDGPRAKFDTQCDRVFVGLIRTTSILHFYDGLLYFQRRRGVVEGSGPASSSDQRPPPADDGEHQPGGSSSSSATGDYDPPLLSVLPSRFLTSWLPLVLFCVGYSLLLLYHQDPGGTLLGFLGEHGAGETEDEVGVFPTKAIPCVIFSPQNDHAVMSRKLMKCFCQHVRHLLGVIETIKDVV